jgi:hypothetical protein
MMKILKLFPQLIDDQMNLEPEAKVIKEELKAVLNLFKRAKSTSVDGWTADFYIGFYDMLEDDLPM